MQLMTRILALSRSLRLGRQLKEIESIIARLPRPAKRELAKLTLREMNQAARCEHPHLYGTPADQHHSSWGTGTDTGLSRARSTNPQIRLRGVALWIAVAFHETRNAENSMPQAQHRHVLRVIRLLKNQLDENARSLDTLDRSSAAA